MSNYFGWINDKPYDFKYKKLGDGFWTLVSLGDYQICQICKNERNHFCVVVLGLVDEPLIPNIVEGFATRWDAIQYALKTHPATRKKYNR